MSDRGSVALKNVRAAEGLVDMIQTTRDFRSDLGGGGWSILWRNEDADRWFIRKKLEFNTKSHFEVLCAKPLPYLVFVFASEKRSASTDDCKNGIGTLVSQSGALASLDD
jgi:hypothetical protein